MNVDNQLQLNPLVKDFSITSNLGNAGNGVLMTYSNYEMQACHIDNMFNTVGAIASDVMDKKKETSLIVAGQKIAEIESDAYKQVLQDVADANGLNYDNLLLEFDKKRTDIISKREYDNDVKKFSEMLHNFRKLLDKSTNEYNRFKNHRGFDKEHIIKMVNDNNLTKIIELVELISTIGLS